MSGMYKLRFTMLGTLTLIIAASTLFFTVILSLLGSFNIFILIPIVIVFNLVQWLLAPKMINAMYHVREVSKIQNPKFYGIVERLSSKIKLKMPKVMIADLPIPNAFAYGSPLTGNHVAVTSTLLRELEDEEVEAVIGHELSHLKHRDVQIMMVASIFPAIFYFIGFSLIWSGMFGGYAGRREGGGGALLIGLASLAIYYLLTLLILGLSRQREYYADRRSVMNVDDGSRKLSEALAKIVASSSKRKIRRLREDAPKSKLNAFKTLFIEDPDKAIADDVEMFRSGFSKSDQQLVQEIISRRIKRSDRLAEIFSTHPNIVKRLRALQKLSAK